MYTLSEHASIKAMPMMSSCTISVRGLSHPPAPSRQTMNALFLACTDILPCLRHQGVTLYGCMLKKTAWQKVCGKSPGSCCRGKLLW